MALARTPLLTAAAANPGTAPFTTPEFTPAAGALLVVIAYASEEQGTTDPSGDLSITDSAGLAWTARANVGNPASWSCGLRAWTATAGPSPAPMTVTVDCGGRDVFEYLVAIVQYQGADPGAPVGATATGGGAGASGLGTDGPATIALDAAPADSSEVIAGIGRDFVFAGDAGVLPGAAWTEVYDFTTATAFSHMEVEARSGSADPAVVWADVHDGGTGTIAKSVGLALEIRAATGPPPVDVTTSADATAQDHTAAAKAAAGATTIAARTEDATQATTTRPAASADDAGADARTQTATTRPASTADAAAARTATQAATVRSASTSATAAAEVRTVATTEQVRSASTREVAAAGVRTEASKQAATATRDAGAARAGAAATTVREARLEVLAVSRVLHRATTARMAVSVVEAAAGTLSVATTVRAEPDEENIYPAARLVRSFAATPAVRAFPVAAGRRTFEVR